MSKDNTLPHFSIVIPARNEEHFLPATINSIKRQKCDFTYEIIVVDNGSIDATADIALRAGVKLVHEPIAGLPRAREKGRLVARGKYIIYIDADTTMPKNYLAIISEAFEKSDRIVAVSNPFKLSDGTTAQQLIIYAYFRVIYQLQVLLMWLFGRSRQVIGGSFGVRADALDAIGGFNTELDFYGEDTEISKRLGKIGVISFLYNVNVETSARRFHAQGSLKTINNYVKNFFSVLIFNRPTNSDVRRTLLKTLFIITVGLIIRQLWVEFTLGLRVEEFGDEVRYNLANNHTHLLILTLILVGIILVAIYGLVASNSMLFGTIINKLETTEKLIALSFDDGPTQEATEKVLAILNDHKVPATFFLIGERIKKHPDITKAISEAGHDIAHHSYQHSYLLPFRTKRIIKADIHAAERTCKDVFNKKKVLTKLYRPPHGWRTPWHLQALREIGYKTILWNVMTLDYHEKISEHYIAKRIIKQTKPGSIIVLHDGIAEIANATRANMLKALPQIIKTLKEQGYRFVKINDLV